MKFWPAVFGCVLLALSGSNGDNFTEFKLYVVHPESREQLSKLVELSQDNSYDFWDALRLKQNARVMVSHNLESKFEEFLDRYNIDFDPIVENVQQILDKEHQTNADFYKRAKRDSDPTATIDFNHFWTLDEIYSYVEELGATNPMVKTYNIGITIEGRPIKALTISSNGNVTMNRPIVVMDSGIHAREWAGIMSVMNMINEFVQHPEQYADQLSNTDYVIVPVLNPDGFVYTHEVNRLWRKNRNQKYNLLCPGVDLNRNFPFQWAVTSSPCTTYYAGPGAASEPETQAMVRLIEQYKSSMAMYVAVHTYGELILWPWGYDFIHCDNADEHDALGKVARDAIVAVGGEEWKVGNSADIFDRITGGSDDFAYSKGARLAYTIELTGGGQAGFDLPASQLPKVLREAMEIYKVFGAHAATLPMPRSGE